ncbi:MAG: MCE family protein [Nocardioidaceae bacterium]|nr:MCE family protein [Nocardioidaceae bacterium]MCL2611775.1 MCE family protein [Nocardioidaceae bacterium]
MTRRLLRWTCLLLSAALLLGGCKFDGAYDLPLPGHPVSAGDSFVVTADFSDVLDVVPRSTVMVDDVVVGEVTDVERVGWHARVTMRVKNSVDLPANATAEIRQVSLLGEKYVALLPPAAAKPEGRLSNGAHIPLSDTGRNPEVEEVLGALSFLLSGGGVAQLGTITREANKVMDGRTGRLRGVLENLASVVKTIDGQKRQIVTALSSMNNLTKTLNNEKSTIGAALDATGPAIRVLDSQHTEMVEMLKSLQNLGAVGTHVINASKGNVLKILKEVDPVLNRIADAGTKLGPGINLLASFPFPKSANAIVKGDYANTIARVQIDFDNLYSALKLPNIQLGKAATGKAAVSKCVASQRVLSANCSEVLGSSQLSGVLKTVCEQKNLLTNAVCQPLNAAPNLDLGKLLGSGGVSGTVLSGSVGLSRGLLDAGSDDPGSPEQLMGGNA